MIERKKERKIIVWLIQSDGDSRCCTVKYKQVKCSYWMIITLALVLTDADGFDASASVLILRTEENFPRKFSVFVVFRRIRKTTKSDY
jgi:hypothetical protein